MKIQCDVCNKEEARVFCAADEAALCSSCDQRVHHANKLAGKHARFSLLNPSLKESPRCDICQERRAFLFCQEDRAILCRECDILIHKSNPHTQNHNRFLLTGVKLSPPSSSSSSSCPGSSSSNDSDIKSTISYQFPSSTTSTNCHGSKNQYCSMNDVRDQSPISTSSISEYLMETLPGWRVDDFLDPTYHGFCKISDTQSPFLDQVSDTNLCTSIGNSAIWVPQAPLHLLTERQKVMKHGSNWFGDGLSLSHTSHSLTK